MAESVAYAQQVPACLEARGVPMNESPFASIQRSRFGTITTSGSDPAGLAPPPPGLARPNAEETFAGSMLHAVQRFTMQMGGLCPDCSGSVDSSLSERLPRGSAPNLSCQHREMVAD